MAVSTGTRMAIGTRVPRVDGAEKVTGQARFGDDLTLYGLLHARLLPSVYAMGTILNRPTSGSSLGIILPQSPALGPWLVRHWLPSSAICPGHSGSFWVRLWPDPFTIF